MSKPQQNKHFWNFVTTVDGAPPELILYGDISTSSWWDDDITPQKFSDELKALGSIQELIVRINSGGGDVFAANAIFTRLKDHAATVTVKIDGWAGSAATIVAMAGDTIEIPANGLFMIHNAKMGLIGYYGVEDMLKMAEEIRVINGAIVNGYAMKTKKDPEEIAAIMEAETWYDGKQAVDTGFCDKLMFEEVPIQVEGASKIIVNSVPYDLERFKNIPSLPTTLLNHRTATPDDGFSNITANVEDAKKGENEMSEIKTVDELRAAHPELVQQIETNAISAERKRIQDIEGIALAGFDSIVSAAKFETPISAGDLATQIIAEQKKQGANYIDDRKADVENSNVNHAGTDSHEGNADDSEDAEISAAIDKVLPKAK